MRVLWLSRIEVVTRVSRVRIKRRVNSVVRKVKVKRFTRFDRVLGLDKLSCVHLNDSKTGLGAQRDRHEQIGQGHVGLGAFRSLLNDPRLAGRPMLLETPKSDDLHEDIENLALLRSLIDDDIA